MKRFRFLLIAAFIFAGAFVVSCFIGPNRVCDEKGLCTSGRTCHKGLCVTEKTLATIETQDAGGKE